MNARSRFSEEQIAAALRDQDAGMKVLDVCEKHGICTATLYAWKAKHGGKQQALKLQALEEEIAHLKRRLADTMLENVLLKEAAQS